RREDALVLGGGGPGRGLPGGEVRGELLRLLLAVAEAVAPQQGADHQRGDREHGDEDEQGAAAGPGGGVGGVRGHRPMFAPPPRLGPCPECSTPPRRWST